MAFIKFQQHGRRDSEFITITNSKSFGFGGDFLEKYQLLESSFVELFFDPESLKIGFKLTKQREDKNAYKLITSEGTNSRSAVARSFFTVFLRSLDLTKYKNKYTPSLEKDGDNGEIFSIKLEKKE